MITYSFEICGARYRPYIQILLCGIPWSIGYSISALIAQLTRDWWMSLIIGLISVVPLPFIYFFLLPESFRYLIAKGQLDKASDAFKRFPLRTTADITNDTYTNIPNIPVSKPLINK